MALQWAMKGWYIISKCQELAADNIKHIATLFTIIYIQVQPTAWTW